MFVITIYRKWGHLEHGICRVSKSNPLAHWNVRPLWGSTGYNDYLRYKKRR